MISTSDILDIRDLIERYEKLEEALETGGEVLEVEYDQLTKLLNELKGNGGDEQWRGDWYPLALIHDDYFTAYAQELVEDCGYISEDFPGWIALDWEATAKNVKMDYTSIEIGDDTYWYR
jgi:hypothetical protein